MNRKWNKPDLLTAKKTSTSVLVYSSSSNSSKICSSTPDKPRSTWSNKTRVNYTDTEVPSNLTRYFLLSNFYTNLIPLNCMKKNKLYWNSLIIWKT